MTDAPNSAPPPDPEPEKKQIPEVDPTTRMVHIGYVSQVPQGAQAIIGVPFWKIKHLAALVIAIEAQQELEAAQERQSKILAPKGVRRDWKKIISDLRH